MERQVPNMGYIRGGDRNQIQFHTNTLEEFLREDNPVRVIDAFVEHLNMTELEIEHAKPASTGRPPYDPKDLLKLYLYGYFNRIRSSRRLMVECGRNIELFYLLKHLTPDFRTIADFRKNNAKALKKVFKAFVKVCMELQLYERELIAIDGSKFRAVNGRKKMYNETILKKKLVRIEENITNYLTEWIKPIKTTWEPPIIQREKSNKNWQSWNSEKRPIRPICRNWRKQERHKN
jgi:transposase